MNCSMQLFPVVLAIVLSSIACSEETLTSGPVCPPGQHQECESNEDSVRCNCVQDGADADAAGDGAEVGDAGTTDAAIQGD